MSRQLARLVATLVVIALAHPSRAGTRPACVTGFQGLAASAPRGPALVGDCPAPL